MDLHFGTRSRSIWDPVSAEAMPSLQIAHSATVLSLSNTHSYLITFCGVAVCNYRRSGYEGPCVGKVEKGKAKGGHGAQTGGLWGKAGGAYNTSDSSVAIAAGARQLE